MKGFPKYLVPRKKAITVPTSAKLMDRSVFQCLHHTCVETDIKPSLVDVIGWINAISDPVEPAKDLGTLIRHIPQPSTLQAALVSGSFE